jgi:hypothetical protein
VFVVLMLWTLILLLADVIFYGTGHSAIVTAVVGLVVAPVFFYAPSSIVIDDSRVLRAMRSSTRFVAGKFGYFVLWIAVAVVLLSAFDFIFILLGGTLLSRYAMLVFSSLFILPFLVVLQSELYMNRFKLLKR